MVRPESGDDARANDRSIDRSGKRPNPTTGGSQHSTTPVLRRLLFLITTTTTTTNTLTSAFTMNDNNNDNNDNDNNQKKKPPLPPLTFRRVTPADLPTCIAIETASYPADEAASPEALTYRQQHAGDYFYCVTTKEKKKNDDDDDDDGDETIIGFACGTRCAALTEESMGSSHDADGALLAVHSVVVRSDWRRRGVATHLLRRYVRHVDQDHDHDHDSLTRLVLLSKARLLGFYVSAGGFVVTRPSPIVHGRELWYELERPVVTSSSRDRSPCFVVDAFGRDRRGTGNPAALVILERPPDDDDDVRWMQTVATEFNLSETAFCWKLDNNNDEHNDDDEAPCFGIRYFTPTREVALCGHATLAAASVLMDRASVRSVAFQTSVDDVTLRARRGTVPHGDAAAAHVTMTFPARPAEALADDDRKAAVAMLRRAFDGLRADDIVWMGVSPGVGGDLLVQVRSSAWIKSLTTNRIDHDALMTAWDGYRRGVILTSLVDDDDDDVDFGCRFFAPKAGVPEDPVTGSAHTVLVPHYHERRSSSSTTTTKTSFVAEQWSPRGGRLYCRLLPDDDVVEITGRAVVTLRGNLQ